MAGLRAALALAAGGTTLWQAARVGRAVRVARERARRPAPPATGDAAAPSHRILLLGDSTGLGLGSEGDGQSIHARLARDWPRALIVNACRSGARVHDTLQRVEREAPHWPRFDLVLLQVGGNDVLRLVPARRLRPRLRALLARLRPLADRVVWAGSANVGLAPLFLPPFSWLLQRHAVRSANLFAHCAREAGVAFIDFCRGPGDDPFSADPGRYYARDGIHPSGEAYALCYEVLRPTLAQALAR